MKYYQRPTEKFFILRNDIFDLGLEPIQYAIYSYLVCCAGSKGYCWPSQKKICDKSGIGITSAQKHLRILEQRKLILATSGKHKSDEYTLLSLDNPEIYRDLTSGEPEELPMFIGGNLPA